jgi:hypothetical protein
MLGQTWEEGRRPGMLVSRESQLAKLTSPASECWRTGKTTGIPPLMAFLPVKSAFSLTHKFSVFPPLLFQLVTVAPNRYTSTLSPEGSDATTFWLPPSPTMSTCAVGPELLGAFRAEGRLARSTILVREVRRAGRAIKMYCYCVGDFVCEVFEEPGSCCVSASGFEAGYKGRRELTSTVGGFADGRR